MGVFGAMLTAVSGLKSQSYALENISGNIANSQTTGFKRVDTSFVDLIPDSASRQALSGSVAAYSRATNTIAGTYNATGVATNIAINGEGFFSVAQRSGVSSGQPVFSDQQLFTRRGDFDVDRDGYLINGSGYFLRGNTIDPVTGGVVGSANSAIKISNAPVAARTTSTVTYGATLPVNPATANSQSSTAADRNLLVEAEPFNKANQDKFIAQTLEGGSITIYNSVGAPVNVQIRWGKTDAGTPPSTGTWKAYYQSDSNPPDNTAVTWTPIGSFTFGDKGELTTPAPPSTTTITALKVNGVSVGDVDFAIGASGLTQFNDTSGLVVGRELKQDGFGAGTLEKISVGNDGRVAGTYSNGQVITLAQISVVNFNAPNGLQRLDGGTFAQTLESGPPIVGLNGSAVMGGTLEGSNTDIAEEFSKMIVTQQAYSANTRVITTAQSMLQDVINIVR